MMTRSSPSHPRITIAVPSYNQAGFIRETLQSLVDQQYPNLEVIIQDAGSTDGAIAIAQEFVDRYPDTFSLYVQKDRGHAHALNMVYARSTGDILGYLNTDDTLYPGCLHRVAAEIDPGLGRYIVFGRCLFTGEGSRYVGLEHPAEFKGRFDLLAIWKRGYNTIPQPSTFWHRKVYEVCGGFDERHNHGLDYLQWCKFSRRFAFHKVDELWSTYRMQPASVTANKTEQEWLDIMIGYSRMNWGPGWRPLRWRCAVSHALYQQRSRPQFSRSIVGRGLNAWRRRRGGTNDAFTGKYDDNWIGPVYRSAMKVPATASRLVLVLEHAPRPDHRRISPGLWLNGVAIERRRVEAGGQVSFTIDLTPYRDTSLVLEVRTPEFFVPRLAGNGMDERRLSLLLVDQRIE